MYFATIKIHDNENDNKINSLVGNDSWRQKRWKEGATAQPEGTTAGEMKVLFGLILLMGMLKKNTLAAYWSTKEWLRTSFFGQHMSRNRFQLLLNKFHVCDDSKNPKNKNDTNYDPFAKIRTVLNVIQHQFRSSYEPSKFTSLDEAGCAFHGVVSFRQYNKSKPNKYHMKLFVVCDSHNAYQIAFEIYGGKNSGSKICKRFGSKSQILNFTQYKPSKEQITLITSLVMSILHKYKLLNKHRQLYTDNWYTSLELALELLEHGTYLAGTVRKDRIGFPKALKACYGPKRRPKVNSKKQPITNRVPMTKGSKEIAWRRSSDGKILAMTWYHRNRVNMLSTIHRAGELQLKDRRGEVIWIPEVVRDYNKYMNGVDTADQLLGYYGFYRRALLWWKKLFFHLVNMCVLNAYILYKEYKALQGETDVMSHFEFREAIALGLIEEGKHDNPPKRKHNVSPSGNVRYNFSARAHLPEVSAVSESKNAYRLCKMCKTKRTKVKCPTCEVMLCLNCYKPYHEPLGGDPELSESDCTISDLEGESGDLEGEHEDRDESEWQDFDEDDTETAPEEFMACNDAYDGDESNQSDEEKCDEENDSDKTVTDSIDVDLGDVAELE